MNSTQNRLSLFAFALAFIFLAGCAKPIHQSEFRSTPVTADGNLNEWQIPLDYYDGDTRLNYTIANDKDNIYLCIRAAEKITQQKIIRGGMTVTIDVKDKKNEYKANLTYPNPPKEKANDAEREDETQEPGSRHHGTPLPYLGEMQLTGFKPNIPTSLPMQNEFGISVGVKKDSNGVLVYEAVIPFGTFYKSGINNADCRKEWVLSVNMNSIAPSEHRRDRGADDGNMGGAGMGGMSGGGMGRGMGGGNMGAAHGMGTGPRGVGSNGGSHEYEASNFKVPFKPVMK